MHIFAGGTRLVSKLGRQPRDVDGDGVVDPIAGCTNEPWGWTNGNGNAGGNGNGNGPCGNNGNGNGGGNGPEVYEKDQYFYHPDHLGSSSYVTDVDGEIFQHLEYFPFGETFVEESSNTQRTPYLFTGKELDEQTGLYYFGARYYDPRTSVWQSPDPILLSYMQGAPAGGIETPQNLSLYAYAHQRPVVATDPNGEFLNFIAGAIIGGAIDLGVQATLVATGVQDDISWSSVAISAGTGASGVGLSSVIAKNAGRVGTTAAIQTATRVGAQVGGETALGMAEQAVRGQEIDPAAALGGALLGEASGAIGNRAARELARRADPLFQNASQVVTDRIAQLQRQIPENSRGRITMAAAVVEDAAGNRKVLIGTSEPRGYLRPGVSLNAGEQMVAGAGHAEASIVDYAAANGLRIVDIGATRPVCAGCQGVIPDTANISTPLKD